MCWQVLDSQLQEWAVDIIMVNASSHMEMCRGASGYCFCDDGASKTALNVFENEGKHNDNA